MHSWRHLLNQGSSILVTSMAFLVQANVTIGEYSSVPGNIYKFQASWFSIPQHLSPRPHDHGGEGGGPWIGPQLLALKNPGSCFPQCSPAPGLHPFIWVLWALRWLVNHHNKPISNWTLATGHASPLDSSICWPGKGNDDDDDGNSTGPTCS